MDSKPSPGSKDTAVKARIISHMNADHTASLTRYLKHYCQLPNPTDVTLEEISLSHLLITSNRGQTRNMIPIDPPMKSYSEARERVVAMDRAALEALDCSDVEVTTYARPRGWMAAAFCVCLATMLAFCRRGSWVEGSFVHDTAAKGLPPWFLRFCYVVQPLVFWLMAVIHLSEAAWMAWSRLSRHGVALFSSLWWLWVVSTFIEGFGAFVRFGELVEAGEVKLGRRKERDTKTKSSH